MRLLSLARSFENVDMYSKVRCIVEVALHHKEGVCFKKNKKQNKECNGAVSISKNYIKYILRGGSTLRKLQQNKVINVELN